MKFKEKYARNRLNKLANKVVRERVLPDVNTIKMIGVLYQPSQKEAFRYLKAYFNRDQAIFRGYCIFEEMANPQSETNSITTNDLNWWGLPKPGKTNDFVNIKFDLLLNIALQQNIVLDYLTALSVARFKVGWSPNEDNFFDLNINISENHDAMYLAKQQIFYLAQLNKKTS